MTEDVEEIVNVFREAIKDKWPRHVSVAFKDGMTDLFYETGLVERDDVDALKVIVDKLGTISIGSALTDEDTTDVDINWITVAKAAEIANVAHDTIRDRIKSKEVRAMKINGIMHVAADDAAKVETKIYVAPSRKKKGGRAPKSELRRRYNFIIETVNAVDKIRIGDLRDDLIKACDFSYNKYKNDSAYKAIAKLVDSGEIYWINTSGNKHPGVDDYVSCNPQMSLVDASWLATFKRR
jgi:hypothetical protein